jgi:hypothetical protein
MRARIAAPSHPTPTPIPILPLQLPNFDNKHNNDESRSRGSSGGNPRGKRGKGDIGERMHDWLIDRLVRLRREFGVIDEICMEYPSTYEEMVERGKGERGGLVGLLDEIGR